MHDTELRGPLPRRMWRQLLDGITPWGSIDIRPVRWGGTCYRIVVYPPGITHAERRRVRLWRGWPMWGAGLWLLVLMVLARTTDPWTALGWATAGYLAVGAAAYVWAGEVRSRVRTAEVHVLASKNDVPTLIRSRVIRSLGTTMVRADEQLAAGEIRSADYEATWWRVYDRLMPGVFEAGIR